MDLSTIPVPRPVTSARRTAVAVDPGGHTWTEYSTLSDHDVLGELADRSVRAYGSKPIPHAKVIAALAAEATA